MDDMVIDGTNERFPIPGELRKRARRISLVLTDNDGVLTDNGVYYSDLGEVLKRYSIRDGMGVARLREVGIETGIISGENSQSMIRRAEKLRLSNCYFGIADKEAELTRILIDTGLDISQIAYIGDDVNDLGVLRAIRSGGLTGAPSDAMPVVKRQVHYVANAAGGHGAFRDFAEWIISLRRPTDEADSYDTHSFQKIEETT